MLKGLALTPPVLGRISIGRLVEKSGKRLPEMDDEFTITSQVHGRDGWITHPVDGTLRGTTEEKLRSIPVWMPFADPDLNLRASYSMFDRKTGRPLCVGNGETCRRSTAAGVQTMSCPAPEGCDVGTAGGCKPYARLNVRIGNEDELGTFIFRTTGFNSIRTLTARLQYFRAVSGGLLAALPLELRLRGKSTTQSHGVPIYFADLTTRQGSSLADTIAAARDLDASRRAAGFDQEALDRAAREGLAFGAFEESAEEAGALVEEFFADPRGEGKPSEETKPRSLREKLAARARQRQEVADS